MADDSYERVLSVKNEVFVYKIPPRGTNRGYRAADWGLDTPDWTGRMRMVSKGTELLMKLEDKMSGELFAQCPVDGYPGVAVEQVLDSSRYFVLRIADPSGRKAFIGIGFADRSDSFDLIVTMQDHFKYCRREASIEDTKPQEAGPKLDLGFKEGQTIRININTKKNQEEASPKSRRKPAGGMMGILPPPPGGVKLPGPPRGASSGLGQPPVAPSSVTPQHKPAAPSGGGNGLDLVDFGSGVSAPAAQPIKPASADPWGDFTSAGSGANSASNSAANSGNDWVTF